MTIKKYRLLQKKEKKLSLRKKWLGGQKITGLKKKKKHSLKNKISVKLHGEEFGVI